MKHYICIDIGGTAVKYGIAEQNGAFVEKSEFPTNLLEDGKDCFLECLSELVLKYKEVYQLLGIAISVPGIVDAEHGEILFVGPNLLGLSGLKLAEEMEKRTGLFCTIENDANCAGLAEYWLGAGQGASSLFCMTVGTGIGGCVILDGRLWHGFSHCAGEAGFMYLDGEGRWEETASTTGLVQELARMRGVPSHTLDGRKIFEEVAEGKEDAILAVDHMVCRLAKGITNICCILNPERIVLGGGIMAQEAYLKPRILREFCRQMRIPTIREHTEISFASLKNDAGMTGALYYFLQQKAPSVLKEMLR